MKRRALFIDRDGTLVHTVHYPSRAEQLRLYEHIGPELRALQEAGFYVVVITNQSGIAHGYFDEMDLQHMHEGLTKQLEEVGVRLDAIYYCPHHPEGKLTQFSKACDCRKPQPGMLLRAAADLDIDLKHSWFIGDILDDVEAGKRAGCHTILVDLGTESRPRTVLRSPTFVAPDTRAALRIVRTVHSLEPTLDLVYTPQTWVAADTGINGYNAEEEPVR
jgi:D-glycero-D-manno-heptose 1,7-bisphosphate phosphatase